MTFSKDIPDSVFDSLESDATLGVKILKEVLCKMVDDDEIFALTAEFMSKMFEALMDAGFSREDSVLILSRMSPFGGIK